MPPVRGIEPSELCDHYAPGVMICTVGDLLEDVVVLLRADVTRGSGGSARIFRSRGGSAANVAALAAAAGGRARFIGQVGGDPLGAQLVAEMEALHVDARVSRSGRTGTTIVLVDADGERSLLTDRGASTQLAISPPDALDDVSVLHVPGYSFMVEPLAATAYRLLGEAVERGIPVTIDASSASVIEEFGAKEFGALLEQVCPRAFFCTRDEAEVLGLDARDPAPGAAVTVVKAGARPTLVIEPDGAVVSVPVPPVEGIVDTTGVGDAFAAGYVLAMLARQPPQTAVHAAHLLASRVLRVPGASLAGRA